MLRRLAFIASLLLGAAAPVAASQIPLLNGPNYSDPSQVLATTNTVIQSVNNGVTGLIATLPAPLATTGTAANTILASTLLTPPTAIAAGQVLHVKAWGVNDANANARTLTFNYGAIADAVTITSTSGKWACDFYVSQQNVAVNAEASQCFVAAAVVAPGENTGTVSNASAIAVSLTATAATAGITTVNGAYMEIVR